MKPYAFHDLPAKAFPFTIELFKAPPALAGKPAWSTTVSGPGAIGIPGLGWPTWVRMSYADGRVSVIDPPERDQVA